MDAKSDWMGKVRSLVDARLATHFDEQRAYAAGIAPEALELVEAVAALTMRGGKRLRPALLAASFRAVAPERAFGDVIDAGAAVELLQSYLLIHDDFMDHDEVRRGGPSVHVAFRASHGDAHLGASLAVLAGNLASAHAWELLTRMKGPEARLRSAIDIFLAMHREVVFGQELDLVAHEDVPRMQQLKTGSYTVRGPLLLGALLAGATDAQRDALLEYGAPLGEAFQMRDDLLGTFGDERTLGKPIGSDLRSGKRNALIRAAEEIGSERHLRTIQEVLGRASADAEAIARAARALEECGAKAIVQERLLALLARAKETLAQAPLSEPGTAMLREVADRLALRDR